MVPEIDICHPNGYCNKSAGQKQFRLEKEHLPVAAFVSKAIVPERCQIDITVNVDAEKRRNSKQREYPGAFVTPLPDAAQGRQKEDYTYDNKKEKIEHEISFYEMIMGNSRSIDGSRPHSQRTKL